jgi:hypothetical protein
MGSKSYTVVLYGQFPHWQNEFYFFQKELFFNFEIIQIMILSYE